MTAADHADLNLVLAVLKEHDALKVRAEKFLRGARPKPVVPFAVGIELLFWCRKHGVPAFEAMGACVRSFEVERSEELLTAAEALQFQGMRSPFDAVHVAVAMHAGVRLVTADEGLWDPDLPTARY